MNPWTSTTTLALGVVLFIAACATAPAGGPASTVSAPGTASAPATTQVQLVDGMKSIPTRPGVRQPFQLATPKAAPVATSAKIKFRQRCMESSPKAPTSDWHETS